MGSFMPKSSAISENVEHHLNNLTLNGSSELKDLFYDLNYSVKSEDYPISRWPESIRKQISKVSILAEHNHDFRIFWAKLDSNNLYRNTQRAVISRINRDFPYNLIVFSNQDETLWDFVNVKLVSVDDDSEENRLPERRRIVRRISIRPDEPNRTAIERLAKTAITDDSSSPLAVQQTHDEAFDVESVAKEFYKELMEGSNSVFVTIVNEIRDYYKELSLAQAFTIRFLSRLMFLHFIQKKGWLGNNIDFISDFWETYKKENDGKNKFYSNWLSLLLYKALNNELKEKNIPKYLPENIAKVLVDAPYLNGGLFTELKDDKKIKNISDKVLSKVFEFFYKYNFTIAEDTPIDQTVAVDPEMIGRVYEGMVNAVELGAESQGESGIFYTPRFEIDMMCRLALVDYLANHIGEKYKPIFYDCIFAIDEDEQAILDDKLAKKELWKPLRQLLHNIRIVDPAAGSGSFLVGMLKILADLDERALKYIPSAETVTQHERYKRIIGNNLYGVDIKDWALRVAELRLWLQMTIEVEIPFHERKTRPLLPNLTFKLRQGDSLVQYYGGIDFSNILDIKGYSNYLKNKIRKFNVDKLNYYKADKSQTEAEKEELETREKEIFDDLLFDKLDSLEDRLLAISRNLALKQEDVFGYEAKPDLLTKSLKEEEQQLIKEKKHVRDAIKKLRTKELKDHPPFVWKMSFIEIFSDGDDSGFDIVIGNPPYVRQEKIADPMEHTQEITAERKKVYKNRLIKYVYNHYPKYFYADTKREKITRPLNAKSDLYIYFYFHALSFLRPKGTFCFITSNSWLDVGFGQNLQEFLLRQAHVKMIIDNKAKRSFSRADINTIIVILSRPQIKSDCGLTNTARFVMFKDAFENAASAEVFKNIEKCTERTETEKVKCFAISQTKLLENGTETTESKADDTKKQKLLIKTGKYTGDKWGGKYLRAPDIYWTILEKGKDKLVRLGDIAEVRRGFTTGCNEFFYLPSKHFDIKKDGKYYKLIPKHEGLPKNLRIEEEFLKPFIKSPKECKSIILKSLYYSLKMLIIPCTSNIYRKEVHKYIKWGEKQEYNKRPTLYNKKIWYSLGIIDYHIAYPCTHNPDFKVLHNLKRFPMDKVFYGINGDYKLLCFLNSYMNLLLIEIKGYALVGGGGLFITVEELKDITVLKPELFRKSEIKSLIIKLDNRGNRNIFEEAGISPNHPIRSQTPNPLPDRKALDDIVFDILGLTQAERNEVYWAVCELVKDRLDKAKSI